jgi:hypothetical protein
MTQKFGHSYRPTVGTILPPSSASLTHSSRTVARFPHLGQANICEFEAVMADTLVPGEFVDPVRGFNAALGPAASVARDA